MNKVMIIVALAMASAAFTVLPDIEVPERKIGRTVESIFDIEVFELIEVAPEINCTDEVFSKQMNVFQSDSLIGKVFIRRVYTCDPEACKDNASISFDTPQDQLEYFDYFMIVDLDTVIQNLTVYNYQATHGHEVAKRTWLSQFIGKDNKKKHFEYGETIDAISGATVSAENFTYEMQYVRECLSR